MILLKIILVTLYLMAGLILFKAAVRDLGGKEVYIEHMSSTSRLRCELTYYLCGVTVTIFWPWVIIFSIIKREDEE